jgi:hypothetical protein
MSERREESGEKGVRTDLVYDGVELGLVPCGEEDVEACLGELNRKLASNAVRCAGNNLSQQQVQFVSSAPNEIWKRGVTHLPRRPFSLQTF